MDEHQDRLREEGQGIIARLGLLDLLRVWGEARVVGSVALGLVVRRDMDIHVLVPGKQVLETAVWGTCSALFARGAGRELRVTDYRWEREALKVAIDNYPGSSGPWSIDIWMTTRPESTAFAATEHLRATLTAEARSAILALKRRYDACGLLKDGLSAEIYEAVTCGGVKTVEEFEVWRGRDREGRSGGG